MKKNISDDINVTPRKKTGNLMAAINRNKEMDDKSTPARDIVPPAEDNTSTPGEGNNNPPAESNIQVPSDNMATADKAEVERAKVNDAPAEENSNGVTEANNTPAEAESAHKENINQAEDTVKGTSEANKTEAQESNEAASGENINAAGENKELIAVQGEVLPERTAYEVQAENTGELGYVYMKPEGVEVRCTKVNFVIEPSIKAKFTEICKKHGYIQADVMRDFIIRFCKTHEGLDK